MIFCAAGQSDDTPPKSVDSDAMSAAPTGLSNNARLVLDSLAADANDQQAGSPEPDTVDAFHRFATTTTTTSGCHTCSNIQMRCH